MFDMLYDSVYLVNNQSDLLRISTYLLSVDQVLQYPLSLVQGNGYLIFDH